MSKENEQLIGSVYRALKQGDKRLRYRNIATKAIRRFIYERSEDRYSDIPPGRDEE